MCTRQGKMLRSGRDDDDGFAHAPSPQPPPPPPPLQPQDARALGIVRSMDLIMYVLYSEDQKFVCNMVSKVGKEVAHEQQCQELRALVEQHTGSPQLYRCLFFLLLDFHPKFRFWVLESDSSSSLGLQPVCPYKAVRFLKTLRTELAPQFLINETLRLDDFERELKIEYLRA